MRTGIRRHYLTHAHLALGEELLPLLLLAVDGITVVAVLSGMDHDPLRRHPLAMAGRVVQGPPFPVVGRTGEHARSPAPQHVVDRREYLCGLLRLDEPHLAMPRIVCEVNGPGIQFHRVAVGRRAVAETTVDRALRGPQPRQWFSGLAHAGEVGIDQRAQHTAPGVSRLHADHGRAGHLRLSPGDRHCKRTVGEGADHF